MSQLSRIQTTVRALIDDLTQTNNGETFTIATAGSSTVLTLGEPNIIAISSVTLNGVALSAATYALSGSKLTVTTTLAVNDVIVVVYTYYAKYSNSEIKSYLDGAFAYLSINNIGNFTIDESTTDKITPILTEKQERLTALITAILIKPLKSSYRTSTISVTYPEKLSKEEKIKQVIADYTFDKFGIFKIT